MLDPLPDFGGHSHRNEFHIPNAAAGGADLMLLRNGGTVNLDSVGTWNQPAGGAPRHPRLLRAAGARPARRSAASTRDDFPSTARPASRAATACAPMLLFPRKDWGKDTLVPNRVGQRRPWPDFLATDAVLAQAAREAIVAHPDGRDDGLDRRSSTARMTRPAEEGDPRPRSPTSSYLMEYVGAPSRRRSGTSATRTVCSAPASQAISAGDMLGARGARLRPASASTRRHLPRHRPHAADGQPDARRRARRRLARRQRVARCGCWSASSIPASFGDVNGAGRTRRRSSRRRCRLLRSSTAPATPCASGSTASSSTSSPATGGARQVRQGRLRPIDGEWRRAASCAPRTS